MSVALDPRGAWTAVVTPFNGSGQLDLGAFKQLLQFQIRQGIEGLVPAGTTGESPTLSWEEHDQVIEAAVEAANGRLGVLAGTGSNCTAEAVKATQFARSAGASGALLVDCYYNKPSSLELRTEYYEAVLEAVPEIPLIPYVIPGRSVTALSAADLAILHRQDPRRIPAVKEATGDLNRMREDRQLAGAGLAILSGDDDLTLQMMQDPEIRAAGVISVMSNLVPAGVAGMVAAQRRGDTAAAGAWAGRLAPLFKLVVCSAESQRQMPGPGGATLTVTDKFPNPVAVKTMMAGLGMPVGSCRRPLGRMTAAGVAKCRTALREVHRQAPELLAPLQEAFGVKVAKRLDDDAVWSALTR